MTIIFDAEHTDYGQHLVTKNSRRFLAHRDFFRWRVEGEAGVKTATVDTDADLAAMASDPTQFRIRECVKKVGAEVVDACLRVRWRRLHEGYDIFPKGSRAGLEPLTLIEAVQREWENRDLYEDALQSAPDDLRKRMLDGRYGDAP